jgi:hypothetical protein
MIFVQTGASDGTRTAITKVDGQLDPGMEVVVEAPPPPEKGGLFSKETKIRF